MTTFQQIALLLIVVWLLLVVVLFRRSTGVLVAGLVAIGVYTLAAFARGDVTLKQLGLGIPRSWIPTVGFALAWLVLMLAFSPVADWLASRLVARPPTLEAFRALQQSRLKLIAGIVVAVLLGGVLEELIARGIVLESVASWLTRWLGQPGAAAVAVCIAAVGAGAMHAYQGPRATIIIAQLSLLFGVLFVVSGYDLWAVILCHGLYDAIAFVRFANRKSKYSNLDTGVASSRANM
jgi:membrane protease YdiL (CAAX protease family)